MLLQSSARGLPTHPSRLTASPAPLLIQRTTSSTVTLPTKPAERLVSGIEGIASEHSNERPLARGTYRSGDRRKSTMSRHRWGRDIHWREGWDRNQIRESRALLMLVVLATISFGRVLLPFVGAIFWAIVTVIVFSPLYERLNNRTNLASLSYA